MGTKGPTTEMFYQRSVADSIELKRHFYPFLHFQTIKISRKRRRRPNAQTTLLFFFLPWILFCDISNREEKNFFCFAFIWVPTFVPGKLFSEWKWILHNKLTVIKRVFNNIKAASSSSSSSSSSSDSVSILM